MGSKRERGRGPPKEKIDPGPSCWRRLSSRIERVRRFIRRWEGGVEGAIGELDLERKWSGDLERPRSAAMTMTIYLLYLYKGALLYN